MLTSHLEDPLALRKHILAVDDDKSVRFVLRLGLQALGSEYEIVTAEDGEEALECLKSNDFDLLITDIKMPKMDGITLTEAARRLRPDLPVIWITAHQNQTQQAERMSVQACLLKPLEVFEIREVVRRAIKPISISHAH
jgi:CheY-like chemotaxis protein